MLSDLLTKNLGEKTTVYYIDDEMVSSKYIVKTRTRRLKVSSIDLISLIKSGKRYS